MFITLNGVTFLLTLGYTRRGSEEITITCGPRLVTCAVSMGAALYFAEQYSLMHATAVSR